MLQAIPEHFLVDAQVNRLPFIVMRKVDQNDPVILILFDIEQIRAQSDAIKQPPNENADIGQFVNRPVHLSIVQSVFYSERSAY